jgi:hypothetical protein
MSDRKTIPPNLSEVSTSTKVSQRKYLLPNDGVLINSDQHKSNCLVMTLLRLDIEDKITGL